METQNPDGPVPMISVHSLLVTPVTFFVAVFASFLPTTLFAIFPFYPSSFSSEATVRSIWEQQAPSMHEFANQAHHWLAHCFERRLKKREIGV